VRGCMHTLNADQTPVTRVDTDTDTDTEFYYTLAAISRIAE